MTTDCERINREVRRLVEESAAAFSSRAVSDAVMTIVRDRGPDVVTVEDVRDALMDIAVMSCHLRGRLSEEPVVDQEGEDRQEDEDQAPHPEALLEHVFVPGRREDAQAEHGDDEPVESDHSKSSELTVEGDSPARPDSQVTCHNGREWMRRQVGGKSFLVTYDDGIAVSIERVTERADMTTRRPIFHRIPAERYEVEAWCMVSSNLIEGGVDYGTIEEAFTRANQILESSR